MSVAGEAPLVSILLPARDAAATLPACLRSLSRQTLTGWECVLIDDESRDETQSYACAHALADPRVKLIARPRAGLVAALNAGLEHCRAPLIARMDADDIMHRDRLHAQVEALAAHPDWSGVGAHVRLFPRAHLGEGMRAYERWLRSIDSPRRVEEEAFVECPVVHPTLMLRAEVLHGLAYRDLGWPEDYDLVLRLLAAGRRIGIVPRRLLAWRDLPGRLTRTAPAYAIDRFFALKAAFLAEGFLAASDLYVLWGYGHTGRALRRALLAHGKRPSHIVELHPGRLGQTIHGAPVVAHTEVASLPRHPLLASVAGVEARSLIRAELARIGRRELHDFVCVA